MPNSGYENLFKPGGFEFAIKAIKVSVPPEQQKALILHLAKIYLLVVDYAKQQNPPEVKKINLYEVAEKVAKEAKLKEAIVENPPSQNPIR
jgi:hypothetical protein